jgi:hypothetical protein
VCSIYIVLVRSTAPHSTAQIDSLNDLMKLREQGHVSATVFILRHHLFTSLLDDHCGGTWSREDHIDVDAYTYVPELGFVGP